MKDIISIFTYCPDNDRKKILSDLLGNLEEIRDKFDILVVSHSSISELNYDNLDYFYYDKNNSLISDFDLSNNFWFKSDSFYLNSTTVYPKSTHLAIYNLLYYTFNFANHKQYKKVHCIEYDINLTDLNLIFDVNENLDEYNTVMFEREDGWIYGTYFAFNMDNFPEEYLKWDEEKIIFDLRSSDSRMTEGITPKILTAQNRTILLKPLSRLDPSGIFQKVDMHSNLDLNWCVPAYDKKTEKIYLFVYNVNGGDFKVDVIYNSKHKHLFTTDKGSWNLVEMESIWSIDQILVLVNGKIKKDIRINDKNRKKFIENNFIEFF